MTKYEQKQDWLEKLSWITDIETGIIKREKLKEFFMENQLSWDGFLSYAWGKTIPSGGFYQHFVIRYLCR